MDRGRRKPIQREAALSYNHMMFARRSRVYSRSCDSALQFHVKVRTWRPYDQVTLAFPSSVTVTAIYDAKLLTSQTTSTTITAELGPIQTEESEFVVMGSGMMVLDPKITCSGIVAPPPSPPHPDDCPLLRRYEVRNAWQGEGGSLHP